MKTEKTFCYDKEKFAFSYLRVTLAKRQLLSIYSDKSVTITKHSKQVKLYNDQFFIVRKFHKRKQKRTSALQPSKDLNMIASETGLGFFLGKNISPCCTVDFSLMLMRLNLLLQTLSCVPVSFNNAAKLK